MENESELLSNYELERLFKMINVPLNQCSYKDLMNINSAGNYIINLDHSNPYDGYLGTHWVALYINPTSTHALYYDSFGDKPPPPIIITKLKQYNPHIQIITNLKQIQHIKSIYCGWFSLFFLYFCHHNNKKLKPKEMLKKYGTIFYYDTPSNREKNDIILKRNIKRIFGI
jgi:hypothetical protein